MSHKEIEPNDTEKLGQRGRGRPRSEAAREAILRAALELGIADGLRKMTIDGIAHRAGVGKQTIYRWWDNKYDVLVDAILLKANELLEMPRTGNLSDDILRFVQQSAVAMASKEGHLLMDLVAYSLEHPELRSKIASFVTRRRAELQKTIGENPYDDVFFDMLIGAVWYRHVFGHAPLNEDFAKRMVEYASRLA